MFAFAGRAVEVGFESYGSGLRFRERSLVRCFAEHRWLGVACISVEVVVELRL